MGLIAFTLTMACESALASVMSGQSVSVWATSLLTPIGLVGLAGQIVFGALPVFMRNGCGVIGPSKRSR